MTTTFNRELVRASAETLREKRTQLSSLAIPLGRGWNPLQSRMTEVLAGPADRIGDVITRLTTLQVLFDELPPSPAANRVAAFNSLYLTITKRVDGALRDGAAQPEFLELLDIEFAKRYFCALGLWNQDDEATPDVWEVLFKRGHDVRMSKLTAAMLGVNAHINHDLAIALIGTWAELGAPQDDTMHPDYLLVNQIFYEEIPPLRRGFSTAWQLDIDRAVGPLDDWTQSMLVFATRAHAWDQARKLWLLRGDADDFEQARRAMDRAASFVGEFAIAGDRMVNGTGAAVTGSWNLVRKMFGGKQVTAGSGATPGEAPPR